MRRKQYIDWLATVFGIFGTIYGAYLLVYHLNAGNGLNVVALILLIAGVISLVFSIALLTSRYLAIRKRINITAPIEEKNEVIEEKKDVKPSKEEVKEQAEPIKRTQYVQRSNPIRSSYSSSSYTTYVKLVGHGPVLRVEGNRILDMRNNAYYRIQDNMVYMEGSGPIYEIRGNQIKNAFGGYLYELSGNNINKTFGGFYASISGSYITLFDLSQKYELTDSLSKNQTLAVIALLFGKY